MFKSFWTGIFVLGLLAVSPARADVVGDFSRLEDTWSVELAPDGKSLAIGCQYQAKRSVCVLPIDSDIEPGVYPAPDNARIIDFYWGSNNHVIIVTDMVDTVGTTNGAQMFRFTRALSFDARSGDSAWLLKDYMNFSFTAGVRSINIDDDDRVVMSLLQRTGQLQRSQRARTRRSENDLYYHTFDVSLDSGGARKRKGYGGRIVDVLYDERGEDVIRTIHDENNGEFEIRDADNRLIYKDDDRIVQPLSVLARASDSPDFLVWSAGESVSGYARGVWLVNFEDGTFSRIKVGDFEVTGHGPVIDRGTNRAVGFRYSDDLAGQIFVDEQLAAYQSSLQQAMPDRRIRLQSWSYDRSRFVVVAESVGQPVEYFLFSPDSGELMIVGAENEAAAARELGQVLSVSYQAADGLDIPAYLTLPAGKTVEDGPFPILLMPHGGPDASDDASYDWWAQAYAASGYAVLKPNFRGSNRYGAAFREAGFGEFGGKMVTDVTDGYDWLVEQGIGQPGGACIVGASYGGYSALMAPLLRPAQIKCAISVNGVTDPVAQMGRYRQTNRSVVSYWEQYMGSSYASEEFHASITPADRTREYRTPVLLIHGDEDTRVRFDQFEKFRKAAGDASWLTSYVMRGEDHFLYTQNARTEVLRESLKFLEARHPVTDSAAIPAQTGGTGHAATD
ncbi:MAG: alpha/beta fold hydrolase [Pseudomonadota bacterium]